MRRGGVLRVQMRRVAPHSSREHSTIVARRPLSQRQSARLRRGAPVGLVSCCRAGVASSHTAAAPDLSRPTPLLIRQWRVIRAKTARIMRWCRAEAECRARPGGSAFFGAALQTELVLALTVGRAAAEGGCRSD